MTIEQINKRCDEIQAELSKEEITEEEVSKLEEEVNKLTEERKTLVEKAEKRAEVLAEVVKEKKELEKNPMEERKEEKKMEEKNIYASAEYRTAYFKNLLGRELNEEEKRAFTSATSTAVIPTETQNEVLKKLSQYAPMLDEITLLNVPGNVTFAVEGTKTVGAIHTENATITGDSDTLVSVTVGGYEVTKLIQVSKTVEKMSISAFETWLIDMISEMVGVKIEDLIFNGTGSAQAKGINKITWGATNSITIAKGGSITADNVRGLIALLPGGYDSGAKFYMTKKTLFNRVMGLQDNAKHDLVREVNGTYYIYGYAVKLSDKAPADEIILGNAKKYVGNLAEAVNVVKDFDINTNSNKYLGCAMFDGKPAIEEAFVKIVQATA